MADEKGPLVSFQLEGTATLGTIRDHDVLSGLQVANFGNLVIEYAQAHPGTSLLLNFENVNHLSSSAISELIRMKEALKKSGGRLALCGLSDNIVEVFEITNMIELLHVHRDESVDVALTKFRRAIAIAEEDDAWRQKQEGKS